MRKQKIYTVISMLALLLLSACSLHQEDDFFDDSSANRMSKALEKYKEILVAPENGWMMKFYSGTNQAYGGYNVLVSFDKKGSAKISSELAAPDDIVESLYSLKQSAGPVLTFDSYNEIMHMFSEPLDGLGGDFEFTIMSATADKVILNGTKTDNQITLIPMPKDKAWADYLKLVTKIQEDIYLGSFYLKVNDKEIGVAMQNNNVFTLTSSLGDEVITQKIPFIYTDEGIEFYEPLTIDGVTISDFKANVGELSFISAEADVNAKLESFRPEGYRDYDDLIGTYKLDTKTVRAVANNDGKTYTLTGITSVGGIKAEYNRVWGTFSITTQYVGMYSGVYYSYLCISAGNRVTWKKGTGLVGVNSVENPLTITFKDNGVWGDEIGETFMMFAFYNQPPSNSNAAGYLERYSTPVVLVKQN